ncbi:hypothetical protein NCCP2716_29120 [Sporosarcina sp. NCCP-2716]|uniref:hypothetical protein n=1 Tax=Sporosarcina sp. NCCP-2716 TaxID=2943679 RepID=UPI00203F1FB7|nr:hypothetical protein [Sporosarcina sp. NCCP-2716]GKV70414.1 hypothetical protein NCCP2716_29120 [Sporosarcina sp. NCCP-2716]
MKKNYFLQLTLIIILTLAVVIFFAINTQKNVSLETYAAYNNKEAMRSTNYIKQTGLFSFLNNMYEKEGEFTSLRVDLNEQSLDQTYYYIKINAMLENDINDDLLNKFNESLITQLDENPFFYAYLDTLKINKEQVSQSVKKRLSLDMNEQLNCSRCLSEASPYIIYYLANFLENQDSKSMDILYQFIVEERDNENLIYYLYWYLMLNEKKDNKDKVPEEIMNIAVNLLKNVKLEYFNDPQTVYNLYWISILLDKPYSVNEVSLGNIKNKMNRTFNLQDLFYELKFLMLYEGRLNNDYRIQINKYFTVINEHKEVLAPLVVIEDDNLIEMIEWHIITNFLIESGSKDLSHYIKKVIETTNPTSSQTEMYYQVLFYKLHNIPFPQERIRSIKQGLMYETKLVENYYHFIAGSILGYTLDERQMSNLKSEVEKYSSENDVWGLVSGLDLYFTYSTDKSKLNSLWEQHKSFLESNVYEMNQKTFFLYQLLKSSMGEELDKNKINHFYKVRRNGDMLLIQGDTAILDISSIYSYLSLLKLKGNQGRKNN